MRYRTAAFHAALAALLPAALGAQTHGRISAEAVFGVAQRSENQLVLPTDGVQAAVRAGLPVHAGLRLLGAASWTSFGDQSRTFPTYCPLPGPCPAAQRSFPGLGVVSLAGGLQVVLPLADVQLRLSGTTGGYWLYHHPAGVADLAPGVEAGLALGLPIGSQLRILLEGRLVHVAGSAGSAASSRRFGVGVAFH